MNPFAVFVSGNGTNMENLIKAAKDGRLQAEPALVICDQPAAPAIEKAERLGVPVCVVERKNFNSKEEFEAGIIRGLEAKKIEWIALAGFMRILSSDFVRRYHGKIINVHPALLPSFPGAHAIRDAFEAKVKETGVTVHFVDEGVDTGPVILQKKIAVNPGESLESFEEKIHKIEYEIYPEALGRVFSGAVRLPKHGSDLWTND